MSSRMLDRTQGQLNALALTRKAGQLPVPATKRGTLARILVTYSDDELAALPEVAEDPRVRAHREDREAAVLGDVIEVAREEAARALAAAENAAAPTQKDLEALEQSTPQAPVALDVASARARFLEHGDPVRFERELLAAFEAEAAEGKTYADERAAGRTYAQLRPGTSSG